MPTSNQDRKVQEARRNLGLLREEAHPACNDYKAHLGELISAVDAKDEPSVRYSFDGVFEAGARLRDIIESDVSVLLDVLAPDDEPAPSAALSPDIKVALRQLRKDLADLPEVARGGLHRTNIGGPSPQKIADQCCCELLDLEGMVSMVGNAVDASSNLPVEMDGAKQVLSYVQYQLKLTRNLMIDCLPFIQDPEVQS